MEKISIIIPAYNEEKRIRKTLDDYNNYFSRFGRFEVIVVTDGCTDKTVEVVKSFRGKNIISMNFPERLGKGTAIIKGLENSTGTIVGFVDADESVSAEDFFRMAKALGKHGCIIASRRVKGFEMIRNQPLKRRIASRAFNLLANMIFGLGIRDTQCGAKIFTAEAKKIIIRDVKTKGYVFDVDVLWKLKRRGMSIKEFPVKWMHAREGTLKIRKHAYKMFFELVKLRFS